MDLYVLTINGIQYLYDCEKNARKAYHKSVAKNGINNVKITKTEWATSLYKELYASN